jgi:hypothetical protein
MKNAALTMAVALALAVLAGCSSVPLGATFQEVRDVPAGKGVIYLYRPHLSQEYAVDFDVSVEGVGKVTLPDGSYAALVVASGVVTLKAARTGETTAVLPLSVEAGKPHFVNMTPEPGFFRYKPTLTLEPVETGRNNIVGCRQVMEPPKPLP